MTWLFASRDCRICISNAEFAATEGLDGCPGVAGEIDQLQVPDFVAAQAPP